MNRHDESTTTRPAIGVVVVTYNSESVISACLDSLATGLRGCSWRAVVVDNRSSDHTVADVRGGFPEVDVIEHNGNRGYAAAVNTAWDAMGHDLDAMLVLNPDTRLQDGSGSRLVDALEAAPSAGIVVPQLIDSHGRTTRSLRREPSIRGVVAESVLGGRLAARLGIGEVRARGYRYGQRADWATGAAMLVSNACLQAVGPWDESFFLYSEETDFCLRAKDAGFDLLYEPGAVVEHAGGDLHRSPELWALSVRNRARLFRQRNSRGRSLIFSTALFLGEALRGVMGDHVRTSGARALLPGGHRLIPATAVDRPLGYVCFSIHDWWYHNRAHSDLQLMRYVSADRTVLLVNSIGMRIPTRGSTTTPWRRIRRKLASMARLIRRPLRDRPRFWVVTPISIPLFGYPTLRRWNAAFVRLQIRLLAAAVGIRDRVYVVTVPTAWDVVAELPRASLVYNRSDRHSSFPEGDTQVLSELEGRLLDEADHVLYVSRALMAEESARTGDRAVFIDHGVDTDLFRPDAQRAADIPPLDGPVMGFFGGLNDYVVDFELLDRLARDIPEATLLLIGSAGVDMTSLTSHPNVIWLGYRPYEAIATYGVAFDVALMPWLQNEWIAASNPIKMKEYLALGLPVVSMPFPEADHYHPWIEQADGHDAFVSAVRRVLSEPIDDAAQRVEAVQPHTWRRRAKELLSIVEGGRQTVDSPS